MSIGKVCLLEISRPTFLGLAEELIRLPASPQASQTAGCSCMWAMFSQQGHHQTSLKDHDKDMTLHLIQYTNCFLLML